MDQPLGSEPSHSYARRVRSDTVLLFFGLAAAQIANNKPDTLARVESLSALSLLQLVFTSAGFGVGLAVNVWIFFSS
jgi:hypothetical protein